MCTYLIQKKLPGCVFHCRVLIAFNIEVSENGLLRSAYCSNGKTKLMRNSVANHLSLFAPVWHVPSVPVEHPKLAQRSTIEKVCHFFFCKVLLYSFIRLKLFL